MNRQEILDTAGKAAEELKSRGVSAFDVYVRASSSTSVEVKEQKLDAFEESGTWGVGIRVLAGGGRMGFAFSTGGPGAVEEAVAKAVANSVITEPDEFNSLADPPASYPEISEYDESAADISEQEKIARAMALEEAATDFDPRIRKVRKASASFTEAQWAIVSSTGVRATARGTWFTCGIMAVAEESGESQMGYDFDYRRRASDIDFVKVGRGAANNAVRLIGARKAKSGLFPVMLENTVAAEFLGVLSASFSADALIKGRSMFADKLGKRVCGEIINIFDDGLMPGGPATRPFDDEGVPSRTTPLISEGVLMGFLHNTYTAKRTGGISTGSATRAGFRSTPAVGGTNLYIKNGNASPEELISSMSTGLIVQEVLGMHTANPISGDFSVGVMGQWVEGGKLAYPVREAAISGNVLSIFSEVEALGSDLRFMGRLGAPSILLKPISVSGS